MREIKYRVWNPTYKTWCGLEKGDYWLGLEYNTGKLCFISDGEIKDAPDYLVLQQFTGLQDKSHLKDIYEDDIINIEGQVIGNKYENYDLLENKTNFLIQGFGTKDWEATNKEAMERGCQYSE